MTPIRTKPAAFLATAAVAVLAAACSSTPAASSGARVTVHPRPSVTGVVTSVSPSLLVIRTRSGARSIVLGTSTTYARDHGRAAESEITPGERVRVRLAVHGATATAAAVAILGSTVSGTVSAVSPGGFTVTTRSGAAYAITVVPTTRYRQGKAPVAASSLVAGATVRVLGTPGPNGSTVAASVRIR